MPVIDFQVTGREPYAGGASFSDAGSFEQIDGLATFAVDPENAANGLIVDLDKVPRDANGQVAFKADFSIVVPTGPGSGKVLVELPNRGRRRVVNIVNRGPAEPNTRTPDPGDGFLFRHGFSVASIGWQHDVYRDDALMGLEAPIAFGVTGGHVPKRIAQTDSVAKNLERLDGLVEVDVEQWRREEGDIPFGPCNRLVEAPNRMRIEQHVLVDLDVVGGGAVLQHLLKGGAHRCDVADLL